MNGGGEMELSGEGKGGKEVGEVIGVRDEHGIGGAGEAGEDIGAKVLEEVC